MSIESINEYVYNGNDGSNSNCIIYSDIWKYGNRCRLVKNEENVHDVIHEICNWGLPGLFIIDKVIDYSKNVDEQLAKKSLPITTSINSDVMMMDKVKNAIQFATYMHKEQDRKDGTPYIKHPLNVLQNVKYFKKSHSLDILLSSAALHDTIEDTEATYYDIVSQFGETVASLVMELTTDEDAKDLLGKEKSEVMIDEYDFITVKTLEELEDKDINLFKKEYGVNLAQVKTTSISDFTNVEDVNGVIYLYIFIDKDIADREKEVMEKEQS